MLFCCLFLSFSMTSLFFAGNGFADTLRFTDRKRRYQVESFVLPCIFVKVTNARLTVPPPHDDFLPIVQFS